MPDQIQMMESPSEQQVTAASDTLLRIKAAFPFDLFPNEIVLDRFKVDVIKHSFMDTREIVTFPLSGTLTTSVNKGFIFSSIRINDPSNKMDTTLEYFWPNDAYHFRQLVQGLVVGIRQGINFVEMDTKAVIGYAMNWGAIDKESGATISSPT